MRFQPLILRKSAGGETDPAYVFLSPRDVIDKQMHFCIIDSRQPEDLIMNLGAQDRSQAVLIRMTLRNALQHCVGGVGNSNSLAEASDLFRDFRLGYLHNRLFELAFFSAKTADSGIFDGEDDEYQGGSVWYVTECMILNLGLVADGVQIMDDEGRYVIKFLKHMLDVFTKELRCELRIVCREAG